MKTLIKFLFLAIVAFLSQSCATLLNGHTQQITITSDERITAVSVENSLSRPEIPGKFHVLRGKEKLKVNYVLDDTLHQTLVLKPHLTLAYFSNIYFNYGIGMWIEAKSLKKFGYPGTLHLDFKDGDLICKRFKTQPKGLNRFTVTLPYFNALRVYTGKEQVTESGFWGLEIGAEHFYKDNNYWSLKIGAAGTNILIDPERINDTRTSTLYVSFNNNHVIRRLDLAYGLCLSQYTWRLVRPIDPSYLQYSRQNMTIGFCFSVHYRIGNRFSTGIMQQVAFLSLTPGSPNTGQNYFSIQFSWKLPFRNKR